jgi:3-hydroxybutyryl-CoA dehydrogenase
MDLIGIDVSLAATRAMYVQADGEPRWRPSTLQRAMVASGRLGRKAGGGFYEVGRSWRDEVGALEAEANAAAGTDAVAGGHAVLERVVAQLVNEAAFALAEGIATADGIDQAMVIGLNHPCGPSEWSCRLGADRIVSILDALWDQEHDPRYRVAPLLRRRASA